MGVSKLSEKVFLKVNYSFNWTFTKHLLLLLLLLLITANFKMLEDSKVTFPKCFQNDKKECSLNVRITKKKHFLDI